MGVFGRVVVGDQLELGDGVDGGVDFGVVRQVAAGEGDAVVIDLILEAAAAGDGLGPGAGGADAGGELDEVGGVADTAAEGKGEVEELFGLDDDADVGGLGLDDGDAALDGHAFGDGADGEADVDSGRLVGLNLDAALDRGVKAGGFRTDIVEPDGQTDEAVGSGAGRDRFESGVGGGVDRFDGDVRNGGAGFIGDEAGDGAAVALGEEGGGGKKEDAERSEEKASQCSIPV